MSPAEHAPKEPDDERVVLMSERGDPIGDVPKSSVHDQHTPLHLGFSSYIFAPDGKVLYTRRALNKRTWPGVWTNSCCGHPSPDEPITEAVHRRAATELGLTITDVTCTLPNFRYTAVDSGGTVENEICPVFCARTSDTVQAAPSEVLEWRWTTWRELRTIAVTAPWLVSPWSALQIPLLTSAGIDSYTACTGGTAYT
ncbi:isopentenyl-diphosphate Delta-isomerase [Rhodococcus cerastii]|nr:isopentenyl-diphosphate Delta-isomerase [Rhodococcus cerastii]